MKVVLERHHGGDTEITGIRFCEYRSDWLTAWGGDEEMPVELWAFECTEGGTLYGDQVRGWRIDGKDIEPDNFDIEGYRVSILPEDS